MVGFWFSGDLPTNPKASEIDVEPLIDEQMSVPDDHFLYESWRANEQEAGAWSPVSNDWKERL